MSRSQLFDEFPDPVAVADQARIEVDACRVAIAELAFICKTVSRLGRGYVLGGAAFCRPGSPADPHAQDAVDESELDVEDRSRNVALHWVFEDHLSIVLSERTGMGHAESATVVESVANQVRSEQGRPLSVARRATDLERNVEKQLLENLGSLATWGWELHDVQTQVRLNSSSRADIVGRATDGTWVVVELKRYEAEEQAATQVLRYLDHITSEWPDGQGARGLVVADGDSPHFYEELGADVARVSYLPLRKLNLPACRPQTHLLPEFSGASVTVAADGLTAVGASIGLHQLSDLVGCSPTDLAIRVLDGRNLPQPLS